MTTLRERQIELEYECVLLGQQRYERMRQQRGETETAVGQFQIRKALPAVARAIERFVETAAAARAGRKHSALPYLLHIEPEQAAYLTLRVCLDDAAAGCAMTNTAIKLGTAVEDHINMVEMRAEAPALYRKVMEQLKEATSERHRKGVLRHVARKYGLEKLKWSPKEKLLLGTKLIEILEETTNLVKIELVTWGRNNTRYHIQFTDEAAEWFREGHARASLWSPMHMPMLVPPLDWTTPTNGGYLTNLIKGARLVSFAAKGFVEELRNVDMPDVYDAVNTIQATAWRINTAVLGVMLEASQSGPRYQQLFVEADDPMPLRPAGIPEDIEIDKLPEEQAQLLREWKASMAKAYAANAKRKARRVSVAQLLCTAERFAKEEAIYFPHFLDFRGRVYPYAYYMNPQGDDCAKGVLQFAEGKPLGARGAWWLKVHIANLFGIDKVSFEDRVRWTEEHAEDLLRSAASPLDYGFWTTADSPWCALAACFEFAGYMVQGEDYVSHLPIAMDGSCSGLQHYSAMLRDPVGGAAVNLVPADKPADIYTQVANHAQAVVDATLRANPTDEKALPWAGGKVVRKIAKTPTMTLCYSATQRGMQGQIENAIRKLSVETGGPYLGDADPYHASVYMAQVIWDSLGEVVVAARQAMDFLKAVAKLAAREGLPIRWTAPSGYPVVQEYKQMLGKVVAVHFGGRRLDLDIHVEGTKLDKKKQAAGVAPNFVHSLDAAHLMATVNLGRENGINSWACIHDSFGVHAADVDVLHACIRETFIEQYSRDVLQELRDEIEEQLQRTAPELVKELPDVPPKGALDLEAVRDSRYFFA